MIKSHFPTLIEFQIIYVNTRPIFHFTLSFPQMKCRKIITTLLPFPCQIFKWDPFFSWDLFSWLTPSYFYKLESPEFSPNNLRQKFSACMIPWIFQSLPLRVKDKSLKSSDCVFLYLYYIPYSALQFLLNPSTLSGSQDLYWWKFSIKMGVYHTAIVKMFCGRYA